MKQIKTLKKLLFFLFLLLSNFCTYGQETTPREIKGFSPFFIGDSIAKFKNALDCIDASNLKEPFSDSAKCRSYKIILSQNDLIGIGPVKFKVAVLSTDTGKTINDILFTNQYVGNSVRLKESNPKQDFEGLANFFTTYLQEKGKKKQYPKKYKHKQKGLIWKSGNYSITLETFVLEGNGMHILWVIVDTI